MDENHKRLQGPFFGGVDEIEVLDDQRLDGWCAIRAVGKDSRKRHATSLIVETNRTWVKDVSNNARRQQTVLGKGGEHETKRKRVRHLFVRLW